MLQDLRLLTNSTDSLKIVQDNKETIFVTNNSITAPTNINLGYRINIESLKNINEKNFIIFGISFQNSFNVLRESKTTSFKNGSDYNSAIGVYKGLSLIFTYGYGFKFKSSTSFCILSWRSFISIIL